MESTTPTHRLRIDQVAGVFLDRPGLTEAVRQDADGEGPEAVLNARRGAPQAFHQLGIDLYGEIERESPLRP